MDETKVAPPPPPPTTPPPLTAYYRPQQAFPGTAEQLEALGAAYSGMSWTFLGHIGLVVTWIGVSFAVQEAIHVNVTPFALLLCYAGVLFLVRKQALRFDFGRTGVNSAGWGTTILWTAICGVVGLIGYIIVSYLIGEEIKRYGIKSSLLGGFPKKAIAARAAEIRAYSQPLAPSQQE